VLVGGLTIIVFIASGIIAMSLEPDIFKKNSENSSVVFLGIILSAETIVGKWFWISIIIECLAIVPISESPKVGRRE
jgi:hypothetical protein